jgi:DNA polymerase-3 subunit delta'
MMSLRPVYGHAALRRRLSTAVRHHKLPASLLLTGPRGVGKQRLALWLGQRLLCDGAEAHDTVEPCGSCPQCRYALKLQHPDLHWFFPRERLKITDPSADDVRADLGDAIADRLKADGLWSASLGMEGLHSATVKALLQSASRRPAMAKRSVFVIGDAERMVSQEGSDQAANAFLKLLEEPPADATLILTSSEPGALLPTIRSRVVTVRVAPLPADDVSDFVQDPAVQARLGAGSDDVASLVARAGGAPGRLLEDAAGADAHDAAQRLLEAALAPRTPDGDALRAQVAASAGVTKARGLYSDVLDALTVLLHARVRGALDRGLDRHARRVAIAVSTLERAKLHTQHNVTPQLITAVLLDELAELLARPA